MISSLSNPQVKRVASYARPKARQQDNVFIVEGMRMLREAPVHLVQEIYVTKGFSGKCSREDAALLSSLQADETRHYETVSAAVMEKMADTQNPQGVLAVVSAFCYTPEETTAGNNPLLLLLENIQDPGNLGTILRTAEAAGVTGIIMSRDCADIYNPKVIRSTMGAIFRERFCTVEDLPACAADLSARGIRICAAALSGSVVYDTPDYTGACGFLIGNEGNGLTNAALTAADTRVRIPMAGQVESLNAAISAAILTFEAAKQRRQQVPRPD